MKILHIDIETSPNVAHVWGIWQQNIGINQIMDASYTMCVAAKWHGSKEVMFFRSYGPENEHMIEQVWELLNEADAVVHYNGTKFDMPTLNKEFILNNLPPPDPYHQIDLLQVARKRFRFPSNKLDYVAKALGLGTKVKHIGHEMWVGCLNNDDKSWKHMEKYNKQDVKLLEKLYLKLLPWIQKHPNHALYTDDTRPTCPNCGGHKVVKKGTETTQVGIYQRFRCKTCSTPIRGRYTMLDADKRKSVLTQSKL